MRVAVIGCGRIGRKPAAILRRNPDTSPVTVHKVHTSAMAGAAGVKGVLAANSAVNGFDRRAAGLTSAARDPA